MPTQTIVSLETKMGSFIRATRNEVNLQGAVAGEGELFLYEEEEEDGGVYFKSIYCDLYLRASDESHRVNEVLDLDTFLLAQKRKLPSL